MARSAQISPPARIPGTKFYSCYPFAGMNLQASAIAMDDKEFKWLENYVRLGDGNLRALWDVGTALYNASGGKKIVSFLPYTIGTSYYFAVFLSDGTAVQVAYPSGSVTSIGSGFYTGGGSLPAAAQYGTLYLLISNRNTTNDYWAWDGSLLYKAGTASPQGAVLTSSGQNYTSLPTVTPYGGLGSGLVITPVINAGGVVNLIITNPGTGYEVGDFPQLQFSGGGSDTGAILTATLSSGTVSAANITAAGSGYTAPTVAFSGGGGTGAAATATAGTGVASITVTNGGTGYTSAPTVGFSGGGGTGAAAIANTNSSGVITSFTVTASGTGYTSAPTVGLTGGGGTSGAGTAVIQSGAIVAITITAGGSGYTSAPSIAISGGGSGATATAILTSSGVAGVTVTNAGTGYIYAPNITFEGGGGSGATGTVQLTGTSIARVNVTSGGQNYQVAPTITVVGGGAGTGATLVPVMGAGSVIAINVTNGGSGYTQNVEVVIEPANFGKSNQDTGTGAGAVAIFSPTTIASVQMMSYGLNYTTAPAVVIGPGANNSAYGTVELMPYGVSGDSMETFASRVWIANPAQSQFGTLPPGGNFVVSAPESIIDFATSDGGVLFTNSDGFLQTRYTNIRQSSGYLYFFGDGSISIVSAVQTTGNPPTTSFSYQNVDPQAGLSWRDTGQDFSKTILFGNETGVYGLYGGVATKVSAKLDQLFTNAIFPSTAGAITPVGAVATLFNVKHYLMLMTVKDPDLLTYRNVMVAWNERDWTIASQGIALTYIGTQKVDSLFTAWGTDGHGLYPLFHTPSSTLSKRIDTKLFGAPQFDMIKDLLDVYLVGGDFSGAGVTMDVEFDASGLAIQSPYEGYESVAGGIANPMVQPVINLPASTTGNFTTWGTGTGGLSFLFIGARLTTTSPDFVLGALMLSYKDATPLQ